VGILADDDLLTSLAMRHECGAIGLRAGWKEQRGGHSEPVRRHLLQAVHGRIVTEDVVTHYGGGHGGTHRGPGARDGVAAQVDEGRHGAQSTAARR